MTPSFLLKGEEPTVCVICRKLFTLEHIFLFFGSDLNEAQLLRMLSEDMSLDYIFDCLKEISVFENL